MAVPVERPLWQQRTDIERVKREGLDVDLARLEREGYGSLTPEEFYRLKTWGVCSQRTPGMHMIRVRVPGGRITAGQLRGVAAIGAAHAGAGVHITTRQNLELHSVPSRSVRTVLRLISELGLTTRSACGHTVRNIVGCPRSGVCGREPFPTSTTVLEIHDFFLINATRYNSRLPRRLNIYVAGCAGCMSHAQISDLGFVATTRDGTPGFQLWCGGSLAADPRLAHLLLDFVPADQVLAVTEAVAEVYIEHGFRDRPATARLKFLIADWGLVRFTSTVLDRLAAIRPDHGVRVRGPATVRGGDRRPAGGHSGPAAQRQKGCVVVEAQVPLGDLDGTQVETLAEVSRSFGDGSLHLTREQNVEVHFVREDEAALVGAVLEAAGLRTSGAGGLVDVQVCAGNEWCVWGVGDARGLARSITGTLRDALAGHEEARPLRVHVSGCSHGCAQHRAADVGLQAVAMRDAEGNPIEGYEVYAGGRLGCDPVAGRRLGRVTSRAAATATAGILRRYLTARRPREGVPEFLDRVGRDGLCDEIGGTAAPAGRSG